MSELVVAAAQFAATPQWEENLVTCLGYLRDARERNVDLLVLPEAAYRSRPDDGSEQSAPQGLDGPFVTEIAAATVGTGMTVILGTVEQTDDPRPSNTLVALNDGRTVAVYRKIHLYDAFSRKESDRVLPGDGPLGVFDVKGFAVGMMTCYDVRFPEVARSLAVQGAQILALPTAWVSGPLKEMHWQVMTRARALENTCYVVAAGKNGPTRIGMSAVIDPLGVVRAQLGHRDGLVVATVSKQELADIRAELPLLEQRRIHTDLQPSGLQVAGR